MTPEPTDPAGDQPLDINAFLDEYFAECDEHLTAARRCVLALESSLGESRIDRGLLDELFRSFHSLKGLSAMVGVRAAEQVAHQLETYLGLLRKGEAVLTRDGVEAMISGTAVLEQIVAARRDRAVEPDTSEVLGRLADVVPAKPTPVVAVIPSNSPGASTPTIAPPADWRTRLAEKTAAGGRGWTIVFTPSPAAAERGVDVNAVRRRLQELGELIHSEPIIEAGGKIAFRFTLFTTSRNLPALSLGDEVSISAFETPQEPPAAAPEPRRADAGERTSSHLTPANLVRVDLTRLDDLLRIVGELVISRARLDDVLHRLNGAVPPTERRLLDEINQGIEHHLRDLREGVMQVRMVAVREVFTRMQFVVRDLAREQRKQAALFLRGEETQIDKYVVERMMDPLLHLVRNAVSHGIESPEERVAAGKSPTARIDLRASTTGDTIVIEIEDDGRGIDAGKITARAQSLGITDGPSTPDAAALLGILCTPGFSTQEAVDRVSGRGVGMDVVRKAVEELGGAIDLQTEIGRGTKFTIQLPLTLAIADALIVSVAGERYAIPQAAVREVLHVESSEVTMMENNLLLQYHGGVLPLVRLDRFFGRDAGSPESFHVLVVGEGSQQLGLMIDRLLGLREIVVRPLTDRLVQVLGIAGATELGDGLAVLILDVAGLLRSSRRLNAKTK